MVPFSKKTAALFYSIFFFSAFRFSADSSYTVKQGDTLYSISRKYQLSVEKLRSANNLSENDMLRAGRVIVIPSADTTVSNAPIVLPDAQPAKTPENAERPQLYEIQKGDTLYSLARKFSIPLADLLAANGLDGGATIKVGQKLKLPQKGAPDSGRHAVAAAPRDAQKALPKTDAGTRDTVTLWPLKAPLVKNISGKISGVELTGAADESVKAVHSGTVMYTGVYRGFGEVVFIQSKTGLIYSYSGLGSVKSAKGDYVTAGDEIGRTGSGLESSIKFMVFRNGMPINPAKAPRG